MNSKYNLKVKNIIEDDLDHIPWETIYEMVLRHTSSPRLLPHVTEYDETAQINRQEIMIYEGIHYRVYV